MVKYKERWGKTGSHERKSPDTASPGVRQLGAGTIDPGSGLPTKRIETPTGQRETWQLVPGEAAKPIVTAYACPNCHHPLDLSEVNREAPTHASI